MPENLKGLTSKIRSCRICVEIPKGKPLPHEPRPVFQVSKTAKIVICGQAPGTRVHASGKPFTDPSGDRLREWMGVEKDVFYDASRIAIVPMGFCFPGLNDKGADLPPRKECAPQWREGLFAAMGEIKLMMLVGSYALKWHLPEVKSKALTEIVADWRSYLEANTDLLYAPMPHPSWRNNHWLKKNPWFDEEYMPELRKKIAKLL